MDPKMEAKMTQLTISQDIRPISDLKARGSEIVTQAANTGRPIVLTRHGRGVAVVLAVDDYERLQQAAERGALVAALREGEQDVEAGRTFTHEEMRAKWLAGESEGT
jgi:prevent-host-death family protein